MNTTPATRKHLGRTVEAFRKLVIDNLFHTHGQAIQTASKHDAYMALSYAVRDYLICVMKNDGSGNHSSGRIRGIDYNQASWMAANDPATQ